MSAVKWMGNEIEITDFCDAMMLALHHSKEGRITFGQMWNACRASLSKVKCPPDYRTEGDEFIRRLFDNLSLLEVLDCVRVKRDRDDKVQHVELTDWGRKWLEKNVVKEAK